VLVAMSEVAPSTAAALLLPRKGLISPARIATSDPYHLAPHG
jgi:hypothetical protein